MYTNYHAIEQNGLTFGDKIKIKIMLSKKKNSEQPVDSILTKECIVCKNENMIFTNQMDIVCGYCMNDKYVLTMIAKLFYKSTRDFFESIQTNKIRKGLIDIIDHEGDSDYFLNNSV